LLHLFLAGVSHFIRREVNWEPGNDTLGDLVCPRLGRPSVEVSEWKELWPPVEWLFWRARFFASAQNDNGRRSLSADRHDFLGGVCFAFLCFWDQWRESRSVVRVELGTNRCGLPGFLGDL